MELEDYKISEAAKVLENANLIKKYHANLVYDYTNIQPRVFERSFLKKTISTFLKWFPKNPKNQFVLCSPPFCEQLCNFCCVARNN